MIDIETMGNKPGSAIVSIGAVMFDPKNWEDPDKKSKFYSTINLQSCLDCGLEVDGSMVYWWMQQSEDAREGIQNPEPSPIK